MQNARNLRVRVPINNRRIESRGATVDQGDVYISVCLKEITVDPSALRYRFLIRTERGGTEQEYELYGVESPVELGNGYILLATPDHGEISPCRGYVWEIVRIRDRDDFATTLKTAAPQESVVHA